MTRPARTCSDCPTPITRQSKTGRCQPCAMRRLHADPAYRDKRMAGLARHFAKPGAREAAGERLRQFRLTMSDEEREKRRAHGRWLAAEVLTPERRAKALLPEARARMIAKNQEHVLGWCPVDRRDEYRTLVRRKRYSAAEARALIEQDLAAETRAAAEAAKRPLTFEEQLARVAAGAQLTTRFVPRRADPEMTLGGVGSSML